MAEFSEVIKQAKRMCGACDYCKDCDLYVAGRCITQVHNGVIPNLWDEKTYHYIERIVMDWAAKNPEPRYPTWLEWQDTNFPNADSPIAPCAFISQESLHCESNEIHTCDECRAQPIPADIAEKLGIKLKEEA